MTENERGRRVIGEVPRSVQGRLHMTIGMTTGLQTGLPTDRRYVYTGRLVCIPVCIPVCKPGFETLFTYLATPTCMFTTPYLQPADGRGQHVLIYIYIYRRKVIFILTLAYFIQPSILGLCLHFGGPKMTV